MTELAQTNQAVTITKAPDGRTNIVLDATMFDTFLLCPQKYHLRHRLNKVGLKPADALERGIMLHVGMEGYFNSLQAKPDWNIAMQRMIESLDMHAASPECELEIEDIALIKKCAIETCNVNRDKDLYYEILAVEQPFAYLLYEDDYMRIIMIGKIDLLVNDGIYKSMPIDHKSYSRDFPLKRKTNQFQNYAVATGSNYLVVNRIGLQTSIAPVKKHKRVPLAYDPEILNQWRNNVVVWCQYYMECEAANHFPLNDTSCDKFNRLCEYYEICDASGVEAKSHKLITNFKDAPKWDVSQSLSRR